ncbi:hypothetical protein SMICM17S_01163 [Streptomyces microflavus]
MELHRGDGGAAGAVRAVRAVRCGAGPGEYQEHTGHNGPAHYTDHTGPSDYAGPGDHSGHSGHIDTSAHTEHASPTEHTSHTTHAGHTGQWTIPVADGDLPDESGEFLASAAASQQWYADDTRPATLPGGAPAPWATQPQPEESPAPVRPGPDEEHTAAHPAADPGTGAHPLSAEEEPEEPAEALTAAEAEPEPPADAAPEESADSGPEPISEDTAAAAPEAGAEQPPEAEPEPDPAHDPAHDPATAPVDVPSEHPSASYLLHVNGVDRPVADAWIGESLLYVLREGAMQVCAAYEGQMDKLAARLGIDPAELRLRNALSTGDILPTGQTVTCPAPVAELLRAVRDAPLPALPKDTPEDDWLLPGGPEGAGEPGAVRRGVGYGVGMVHMLGAEGADEVSTATVRVHDGVATVICAAVETGQGFTTLARQVVQEVLGIDEVHVAAVDTDQPPAGPATHGRHTWVSGGAVERAAKMVRTQLLQPLAHKFGMSTELLQIADGKITSYDGVLSTTVMEAMDGKELWATAQCRPHPTEPLDESGQGDAFVGLAFCAVRAVVDVDIELGSIRVVEMAVAQDVGRVLNPAQLAIRIEAGITQGIGAALTENLRTARGLIRHPDLTGYALPTSLDAPDIRIVKLVEERDVVAPFGAKPVSAVPVVTAPAAVASAVRSATGRPVNRLPVRPQAAVVTPKG